MECKQVRVTDHIIFCFIECIIHCTSQNVAVVSLEFNINQFVNQFI